MATDFVQKWGKITYPLDLSLCHSETEWAVVLRMNALIAPLIALHRVKQETLLWQRDRATACQ